MGDSNKLALGLHCCQPDGGMKMCFTARCSDLVGDLQILCQEVVSRTKNQQVQLISTFQNRKKYSIIFIFWHHPPHGRRRHGPPTFSTLCSAKSRFSRRAASRDVATSRGPATRKSRRWQTLGPLQGVPGRWGRPPLVDQNMTCYRYHRNFMLLTWC